MMTRIINKMKTTATQIGTTTKRRSTPLLSIDGTTAAGTTRGLAYSEEVYFCNN